MSNGTIYYYGIYRAILDSLEDPDGENRIGVKVVSIPGQEQVVRWAMPCVPYAGENRGMFLQPEIGDQVWVEFEGGDLTKPVWVGSFWAQPSHFPSIGSAPGVSFIRSTKMTVTIDDMADVISIETPAGAKLVLDEGSGVVTLEHPSGNKVQIDVEGLTLQGWPLKFKSAPPLGLGDLEARVTSLEANVQQLLDG